MRKSSNEFDKNGYLTLFDNNTYLKDPLFWLQNLKSKISFNKVIDFLEELLLNNVRIEKDNNETIQFKEKGYKRDFKQLSDGYQSTIIWVCDLLSRLFDNQSDVTNFKDFKAIVLFDEIGAFLHPKWEYQFVSILRKYFKNIQWIFTTHCPIITLGASKDAVFYKLYKEDGITKVVKPFEKSLNMTANSLLTSPLWRLKFFTTPDIIPKMKPNASARNSIPRSSNGVPTNTNGRMSKR